jgi:hypothetical protein
MTRKAQDGLSIMRLQVLSSFLFHSEHWEGPLFAELVGNGFFFEFTSIGNFLVNKIQKNEIRRVPIIACFLVNNSGGKKVSVKRRILCVKRILFSFPQFLSVGVQIFHEVPQCTQYFFKHFDQHPQKLGRKRKNSCRSESNIKFLHKKLFSLMRKKYFF